MKGLTRGGWRVWEGGARADGGDETGKGHNGKQRMTWFTEYGLVFWWAFLVGSEVQEAAACTDNLNKSGRLGRSERARGREKRSTRNDDECRRMGRKMCWTFQDLQRQCTLTSGEGEVSVVACRCAFVIAGGRHTHNVHARSITL